MRNKEYGCKTDICKYVEIDAVRTLYVPNALYPEAVDGSNVFLPKGKSLKEYHLQIFDKFGNLLWETDEIEVSDGSPKNGWGGMTENGIALPQGTYIWKIHAIFSGGSTWEGMQYKNTNTKLKEGTLYLIR